MSATHLGPPRRVVRVPLQPQGQRGRPGLDLEEDRGRDVLGAVPAPRRLLLDLCAGAQVVDARDAEAPQGLDAGVGQPRGLGGAEDEAPGDDAVRVRGQRVAADVAEVGEAVDVVEGRAGELSHGGGGGVAG